MPRRAKKPGRVPSPRSRFDLDVGVPPSDVAPLPPPPDPKSLDVTPPSDGFGTDEGVSGMRDAFSGHEATSTATILPEAAEGLRNAWGIEPSGPQRRASDLPSPSPEGVPELLLRLNREVGVEMQDDEIVHAFVEGMRAVFPGRRFVVRLAAGDAALALFYATGRLSPDLRDPRLLEASAATRHALSASELERLGVRLTHRYAPFFEARARGFDVPLTDGARLVGVLSIEYPTGVDVPTWDAPILVPLALELASKLRGARLVRESNYLREYLAQVMERANAPIVVLDASLRVQQVNVAFLGATATRREDWVGFEFVACLPERERGAAATALEATRRGRASSDVELRFVRGDRTRGGARGFARITFNTASILAADGELTGIVAIGQDMTAVRDLEEQVVQAEKLATLGQLAAGVVHELNNPLTSISVYGDYLLAKGRREGHDAGDLEKLARITDAAARMLRFTRDLVTYARPSSEEPTSLSIADVLDQSLTFCEHVLDGAGVRATCEYEADLPPIRGVRGQLHQVFINLFTNACHAMATSPSGQLVVRTSRHPERGVAVCVEDDGPGIAPEHLDRIFEPFFSTKGEGRGTGLGLSIVRNLVERHGGSITVTTRQGEGHGTRFLLRFPV